MRGSFQKISSLIHDSAAKNDAGQHYKKYRVFACWPKASSAYVKNCSNLTQPMEYINGRLKIACLSPECAKEIQAMEKNIISALNTLLEEVLVREITLET